MCVCVCVCVCVWQAKGLRLPNTEGVMTGAARLVYDDAPWLSTSVQVCFLVMQAGFLGPCIDTNRLLGSAH